MAHVLRGTIKRQAETIARLRLQLKEMDSLYRTQRMTLKVLNGVDIKSVETQDKVAQNGLKRPTGVLLTNIIRKIA